MGESICLESYRRLSHPGERRLSPSLRCKALTVFVRIRVAHENSCTNVCTLQSVSWLASFPGFSPVFSSAGALAKNTAGHLHPPCTAWLYLLSRKSHRKKTNLSISGLVLPPAQTCPPCLEPRVLKQL